MINNINELDEKMEKLEKAIVKMPYGWQISPHGNLEHLGDEYSNIHCYQREEAELIVKALHKFYFPKSEKK